MVEASYREEEPEPCAILDRVLRLTPLEQLLVGLVENEVVDRAELQLLARKLGRSPRKED